MKDNDKKKGIVINLDKVDRALETHYFVVYLIENEDEKITSTRTECFKIPFDIENELVNELELFGDIELVSKDTYVRWTGQDRTHNGKVLLKKGKIYDVICIQNGRAIIDLGHALYGWVRPKDFELFAVTEQLDYENSTLH